MLQNNLQANLGRYQLSSSQIHPYSHDWPIVPRTYTRRDKEKKGEAGTSPIKNTGTIVYVRKDIQGKLIGRAEKEMGNGVTNSDT